MSPSEDATAPSRSRGAAVLDPAEENGCLEAARRALRRGTRGVEEDLGVVSDRLRQRDPDADEAKKTSEWGEFLHLPGQKFFDFDEIRNEISRETERVTAGNGAPRRENLERFLAERPEYSVYQDAAPSPRPLDSPRGPKGEDEVRQFWTEAEDAQLVSLVRQYGVGEWTAKSQVFATARSANSLRKRWTKIEEEEIQKGGVPGAGPDERV